MKCFFSVAEWWQKNGTSEAHDEIVDCLVNHCAASGKNYESEISVTNEEREREKNISKLYIETFCHVIFSTFLLVG